MSCFPVSVSHCPILPVLKLQCFCALKNTECIAFFTAGPNTMGVDSKRIKEKKRCDLPTNDDYWGPCLYSVRGGYNHNSPLSINAAGNLPKVTIFSCVHRDLSLDTGCNEYPLDKSNSYSYRDLTLNFNCTLLHTLKGTGTNLKLRQKGIGGWIQRPSVFNLPLLEDHNLQFRVIVKSGRV